MDYASSLLRIVRIILDTLICLYLCWDYFAFQAIAFSYVNHFRLAIHGLDMYKSTLRNVIPYQSHA